MFMTTKSFPLGGCAVSRGSSIAQKRTNVSRETFCGELAGRRPGGAKRRRNGRSSFARRDGGRPAAGSGGLYGHQPSSCRRTRTNITPAIREGMADKRSLPPGEAGISSSQLMVIISPAMQAVTMPMV